MSQNETIRPANELEWLIIEPHVTRWLEAQQRLQAVVQGIAPEPGARFDLDTKSWTRAPMPLTEAVSPEALVAEEVPAPQRKGKRNGA